MSRLSKRAKLQLTNENKQHLQKIAQSRTEPLREVQRAKILFF
jgi:hypothetical protein